MSSEPVLREPAHQVDPRAINYWRVGSLVSLAITLAVALPVLILVPGMPWWGWAIAGALVLIELVDLLVVPRIRYRIHRWEVTPTAIYAQSGWLRREMRIAPLSRVQTVDTRQNALARLFRLSSITVTTASAAGPISIFGLDQEHAKQVVAELTAITAATEGDAT